MNTGGGGCNLNCVLYSALMLLWRGSQNHWGGSGDDTTGSETERGLLMEVSNLMVLKKNCRG
jgi:hypothetical protein